MFKKWENGFRKGFTLLLLITAATFLFSVSLINVGCEYAAPGAADEEKEEINAEGGVEEAPAATAPAVGSPAPHFTLTDLQGNEKGPADFRGETTLLSFWTTWCSYCQEELELLQAIHEREEAAVLAVNVEESESEVQNFIRQREYTFPVVLDSEGEVFRQYRLRGFPSTFVLNAQGEIASIHIGPLDVAELDEILRGAAAEQRGPV